MGKNAIFTFSMRRRPEGSEILIRSKRIEDIMKMLSQGRVENEYLGNNRNRDRPMVQTYRPTDVSAFFVEVPGKLREEMSLDTEAACGYYGLTRPPVFRENTTVYVNMSWLTIVGVGSENGVQTQMSLPITITDVRLCSEMIKRAATRLIEDYGRPFSVTVTINEQE